MGKIVKRNARIKRTLFISYGFILLVMIFGFGTALAGGELYLFKDEGTTYFTNQPGAGRVKVQLPLKKSWEKYLLPFTDLAGKDYQTVIAEAGQRFDLDPHLISAVIKTESNFNPLAVSPKGAKGLMQLMPKTAEDMGVANPFDPVENILGGVKYLSRLLNLFNGDYHLALAAYNAGPARVLEKKRIPPIAETRQYVRRVMDYYQQQGL